MPIPRRNSLYLAAFVSVQLALWGAVLAGRAYLAGRPTWTGAALLSTLGFLAFWLSWMPLRRGPWREFEERSGFRGALFLHALLWAALVPGLLQGLGLANRLALRALGLDPALGVLGAGQSEVSLLLGLGAALLLAGYFFGLRRSDWPLGQVSPEFVLVRRISRYGLLVIALVIAGLGAQQALLFGLLLPFTPAGAPLPQLANAAVLLAVGAPLLWGLHTLIRRSLAEAAEFRSLTRLRALLAILGGAWLGMALAAVMVLAAGLGWVLAGLTPRAAWELAAPGLAFAAVWGAVIAFYRGQAARSLAINSDPLRRQAARRLLWYALALAGLVLGSAGVWLLAAAFTLWGGLRWAISLGAAALVSGGLLWYLPWRLGWQEAKQEVEVGAPPRLAPVRRIYLFTALYLAAAALLGGGQVLLQDVTGRLFGVDVRGGIGGGLAWMAAALPALVIHLGILMGDQRAVGVLQRRRYAQFPVLVLVGAGPTGAAFGAALSLAVQRLAPELPVALHPVELGVPDANLGAARLVVLPAELLVNASEALRLWLAAFPGLHLVVPLAAPAWRWISVEDTSLEALAERTAAEIRQVADR